MAGVNCFVAVVLFVLLFFADSSTRFLAVFSLVYNIIVQNVKLSGR